MNEEFQNNIKNWVKIDNELKEYNEKIKNLREQKNSLLTDINIYIDNNNLNNATVSISDGKLKFINSKVTNPLTLKYISSCLENFIKDESQVKMIMEYIKTNRDCKEVPEIKRYYNN